MQLENINIKCKNTCSIHRYTNVEIYFISHKPERLDQSYNPVYLLRPRAAHSLQSTPIT